MQLGQPTGTAGLHLFAQAAQRSWYYQWYPWDVPSSVTCYDVIHSSKAAVTLPSERMQLHFNRVHQYDSPFTSTHTQPRTRTSLYTRSQSLAALLRPSRITNTTPPQSLNVAPANSAHTCLQEC